MAGFVRIEGKHRVCAGDQHVLVARLTYRLGWYGPLRLMIKAGMCRANRPLGAARQKCRLCSNVRN